MPGPHNDVLLSLVPAGRSGDAGVHTQAETESRNSVYPDALTLMDEWGPEKIVCVSDQKTGMRGVLVLDNTARGMGKGGTRMSPTLTVNEVARLARTMTWKWAAVDLYHGGAKAGILGDPNDPNKEAILRAFARALAKEVPSDYVFGLDMGLAEADAAIFVDELRDQGAAVGLPRALGGVPYDQLGVTGFGVAEAADAAAAAIDLPTAGARVVLQGFGAVGQAAAERFVDLGANIIGISTAEGSLHDDAGLDIPRLIALRKQVGDTCVREYGTPWSDPEDALWIDTDILVPAAREDVIGDEVANATKARLIVEGANMPTTADAKAILNNRGVTVVPDFIANAGGVVAAAHSMDMRYSPFTVDPSDIFTMISDRLRGNTIQVLADANSAGTTPHQAARALARRRVLAAMEFRGQRPRSASFAS